MIGDDLRFFMFCQKHFSSLHPVSFNDESAEFSTSLSEFVFHYFWELFLALKQ